MNQEDTKPQFETAGHALAALRSMIHSKSRVMLEATVFEMMKPYWLEKYAPGQTVEEMSPAEPSLIQVVKS